MTSLNPSKIILAALLLTMLTSSVIEAQTARPALGDNQRSKVCQWMGQVEVCVTYNSPDVTSPAGKSRRGEIWGKLVPFGPHIQPWMEKEGEAPTPKPWRAGANENTVISFSHDVLIEGKPIKAGEYGLFFNVGENQWELILSTDANKWGVYFYDEKNDALWVNVIPEPAAYREWLTYDFTTRKLDSTTLALWWEDITVPIHISIPNIHAVYIEQLTKELTSNKMLSWYNWHEAAKYCLDNNVELELGLHWIEKAIDQGWIGHANFGTLKTKAEILHALNRKEEGESLIQFAIQYTGGVYELHNYGRELLSQNKNAEALQVFKVNAKKHPDYWVPQLGLARGFAAIGDSKSALKYAQAAKKLIPKHELGVRHFAIDHFIEQVQNKQTPLIYLARNWTQVY